MLGCAIRVGIYVLFYNLNSGLITLEYRYRKITAKYMYQSYCNKREHETKKKNADDTASKVIVVFAATGRQGGGVIEHMKGDSNYTLRAVTRNKNSVRAQKLAAEGVEVVEANFDDVDTLKVAVKDAFGVFAVTDSLEVDVETEIAQGKHLADACKECNVKLLVYSGLENVEEQLGKKCAHFDSKAKVEDYIKELDIPYCFVHYPAYIENLFGSLKPRKTDEGEYILDLPMDGRAVDLIPVFEAGECIHQIFNNCQEYTGVTVGLSSGKLTVPELADILSKHLGKTVKAGEITCEQMANAGFPMAADYASMFEFYQKGKFSRDIELTKKLNPNISNIDDWVFKHKDDLNKTTFQ